jgi:hypothetical protein
VDDGPALTWALPLLREALRAEDMSAAQAALIEQL